MHPGGEPLGFVSWNTSTLATDSCMNLLRHLPRSLLSLLLGMLTIARVEAQSIPVPQETPRAGAYATPAANARSIKPAWRPKGSVIPAQAESPVEPEPTLAPPLEAEPVAEMQPLRGPANPYGLAGEEEPDEPEPQPALIRPNPLRATRPPQTSRRQAPQQQSPLRRVQNPVEMEYEPEPLPRPPPRMLNEVPGPQGRPVPNEAWQVAPGRRIPAEENNFSRTPGKARVACRYRQSGIRTRRAIPRRANPRRRAVRLAAHLRDQCLRPLHAAAANR